MKASNPEEIIIIYQEINVHKVTSVSFNNKLNLSKMCKFTD